MRVCAKPVVWFFGDKCKYLGSHCYTQQQLIELIDRVSMYSNKAQEVVTVNPEWVGTSTSGEMFTYFSPCYLSSTFLLSQLQDSSKASMHF